RRPAVRTPPFHVGNTGSNPVGDAIPSQNFYCGSHECAPAHVQRICLCSCSSCCHPRRRSASVVACFPLADRCTRGRRTSTPSSQGKSASLRHGTLCASLAHFV